MEWEIFTIKIFASEKSRINAVREATQRFEAELSRLVKEYQGKDGLQFKATDSLDREITED